MNMMMLLAYNQQSAVCEPSVTIQTVLPLVGVVAFDARNFGYGMMAPKNAKPGVTWRLN